jgi:uncharacterized protein (TIGR02266 family)
MEATRVDAQSGQKSLWAVKTVLLLQHSGPFRSNLMRRLELSGHQVLTQEHLIAPIAPHLTDVVVIDTDTFPHGWQLPLEHVRSMYANAMVVFIATAPKPQALEKMPRILWLDRVELGVERLVSSINMALRSSTPGLVRANNRVPFRAFVDYRANFDASEWFLGYSQDISPGGIFVRTLAPLYPGTPVELKVRVPGGEPLRWNGLVAWANSQTHRVTNAYPVGMGIQFSI